MLNLFGIQFGRARVFRFFCLAFIAGVFIAEYLNIYAMVISAMVFILVITIWWHDKKIVLAGFLGLVLLLGAWRYHESFPDKKANFIGKFYGQEMEIEGIVIREPDMRSEKTNLTVSPSTSSGIKLEGRILLNVGKYPEYQYGDKLKISGELVEPFVSEEFSYKDYLARYETYAVIRYPKIEKLAEGQGNPAKAALLKFKARIVRALSASLPEPHNSLLLGIILGLKRALPADLAEALAAAGVSHIVVISGFNISIMTNTILKARQWIGRRIAFSAAIGVVLAFVVMTGAEASVVRAAIMGGLLVVAMGAGRLYQSPNAIVLAGALMVLANPKILRFDIGFQLSFMATLGIFYLSPILEKWFTPIPNFYIFSFRDNLATTMAALLFVLPLLIFYFGRLSLVAVAANVAILWAVPYIMYVGLIAGLLGAIYAPLVNLFSWLLWALLEYVIWFVEFFAKLPFAAADANFPFWLLAVYYLLLFAWLLWFRKTRQFHYYLEYIRARF